MGLQANVRRLGVKFGLQDFDLYAGLVLYYPAIYI